MAKTLAGTVQFMAPEGTHLCTNTLIHCKVFSNKPYNPYSADSLQHSFLFHHPFSLVFWSSDLSIDYWWGTKQVDERCSKWSSNWVSRRSKEEPLLLALCGHEVLASGSKTKTNSNPTSPTVQRFQLKHPHQVPAQHSQCMYLFNYIHIGIATHFQKPDPFEQKK